LKTLRASSGAPTSTATRTATPGAGTNLALNKPVTSSSSENAGTTPNLVVDGNIGTRWSSAFSDPQWIQVSNDAVNWTSIYSTTTGDGGTDDLTGLSGSGRYVRMNGTARGTAWGYSLWEFGIYH